MNDKEKAKAYDEALKDMQAIYPKLNGDMKLAVEHAFPQLAESEDERIRKRIRLCLDECVHSDIIRDYERDECLAYLEKQKEPENTSASTMVPSCWEVEQKEQKPVQSEVEREYVRTLKSLISDFLRGKEDVDREYYQQIFDWLDGRHIEQKPVDFPTTDEEVNEFLETHSKVEVPEKYKTPDFVLSKQEYESYPIISKDTTSVKPEEWSDEDERNRDRAIFYTRFYQRNEGTTKGSEECIDWLKSLRNRVGKESLQPHWKPTEEQMEWLKDVIETVPMTCRQQGPLESLYADLQKLL